MASLIEDLSRPGALPDPTSAVSVVQTHISIVFMGDEYVYKVKKPVDFGFLDFTTLEKRRYFCERELKLNRRLSKRIYLDVLPVRFNKNRFSLTHARGDITEYAVRMKRIPDERLMKSVFDRNEITREHLDGIASVISRFHSTAARSPEIDAFGQPETFKINTDENFDQVEKYVGLTVEKESFDALRAWTDAFYGAKKACFHQRIREGRIRDCHGDLHMEHVCIMEGYPIIDCIEFNNRFRYGDTLADIAFLIMDLEYWGGDEASADIFWQSYRDLAGEGDVEEPADILQSLPGRCEGEGHQFSAG